MTLPEPRVFHCSRGDLPGIGVVSTYCGRLVRMVRLRVLASEDWWLWRDARLAALAESPHAFKSRLEDWGHGGEKRWRARFEEPGAQHVVAFLGSHAVGMASGRPSTCDAGELRSVWVSPTARGHGVGDLLIGEVEAWACRSGLSSLRLGVLAGNEPAIMLYQRHGFVLVQERGEHVPEEHASELVMVKPLGYSWARSANRL